MTQEEKDAKLKELNDQRQSEGKELLTELPAENTPPAFSDEDVFKKLSEQLGKEIKSYEDLKPAPPALTEDQLRQQAEERENKKTAWALANNKISEKQLKSFAVDSNDPESLVYADFYKERKAANPDAKDDDIEANFEIAKERMGETLVKSMGEALLRKKYPEVYEIDNLYNSYELSEKDNASFGSKMKTEAPAFVQFNTATVENYVNSGIEVEVDTPEGAIKLKFEPNKDIAKNIAAFMTSDERVKAAVKNGYNKDEIQAIIKNSLINADLKGFAQQVYEQAVINKEAIVRGIPPSQRRLKQELLPNEDEQRIAENQKVLQARFGKLPVLNN